MNLNCVSYQNFDATFREFKNRYYKKFNEKFERFDAGTIREWEAYKPEIAYTARELLGFQKWTPSDIGSGKIFSFVISALKARTPSGTVNNLVHWTTPRNLTLLIKKKDNLDEFEENVYNFYKGLISPDEAFDNFTTIIGKQYSLIAYLFFIQDPSRYLPIAPSFFDPLFDILGIEFKTSGKASWENYQKYLSIIRTIQHYLIDKEYRDTRLIDAHSFCWMVSILEREDGTNNTFSKKEIQKRDYVPFELLTKITANKPGNISNPNSNSIPHPPDEDKLLEKYRNNVFFGYMAEERVFEDEKKRLLESGHAELAKRVEWTSRQDMSAGYDILSFDVDGAERFIEVKASSGSQKQFSFILSDPEFKKSRILPNYYIYCVLFKNSKIDRIIGIPSKMFDESFLQPLNYRLSIRRSAE